MEPLDRQPAKQPGCEVRIESVGVCALDRCRVDVAVDLTPSAEGTRIEVVIEAPSGAELVSATVIDNRQTTLDRRLHVRRPPEPGTHTLHVGVFYHDALIDHVQKQFTFPPPDEPGVHTLPGPQVILPEQQA